jgi:asparagine synthase (glutamine-hydrolysing)
LRSSFNDEIPASIFNRKDKMGFPVPLQEWFSGPMKPFIEDIMSDIGSHKRDFLNADAIRRNFAGTARYSRKMWALVSLELWQQMFHDKSPYWKSLIRR